MPVLMTVLLVPVLRVAPDATETTPPQGDSAALQSAPEITLEEVVEDLDHKLQLCRMQTQEAHFIAQDSLVQATALRTEFKNLRSQLADLEAIVMTELIQDLPAEDQGRRR
jgi:DNA-binding IscR family transcriptional regulator